MASSIGKSAGEVTQAVSSVQESDIFQGILNKGWRGLILINRLKSPMPKAGFIDSRREAKQADILNHHIATEDSASISQLSDPWMVMKKLNIPRYPISYTRPPTQKVIDNQIIIFNTNDSPAISIVLQNRPSNIQVNPVSYWVSVKSMGRNNPFMLYTGGEDSIQLDISWFVNDSFNREEVLTKCRLLESWTKADGYVKSPPTLKISWGSSGIFDNDLFILESAPYQLSNFQNASKDSDLGLLPQCATQTLTFKRVTRNNRSHAEIVPIGALAVTKGIKQG